jgi:hypothetical protein
VIDYPTPSGSPITTEPDDRTPPPSSPWKENHPAEGGTTCNSAAAHPEPAGLTEEEARFASFVEDLAPVLQVEEFDLASCPTARFDLPSPIQLEQRGITSELSPVEKATAPAFSQSEFWTEHTTHKNSIAAKLRSIGRYDVAEGLEHCHSEFTYTICDGCGKRGRFPNRCDCFYCPECQPRLSHDRKEAVGWWARLCPQPKFVTLTVLNIPDLTKGHVKELKKWWTRLRGRKFASNWTGGFYSIEVTNEGRGWHLHLHALINAKWIDAGELARQWNACTNGLGNIVKVKDARAADYLAQVTKYVAKGAQVASWTPDQIASYIDAFTDVRTFGVFGDLYGARTEFAEFIASLRDAKPRCDCGCQTVRFFTEAEWLALDLQPALATKPRPPDPHARQIALFDAHTSPYHVGA